MWIYEKKLEYPVKVSTCNPALAAMIIEQFGGADGELAASLRYLTQRWTMPTNQAKAILTDIGTEELAHWEMIGTIVYQLTKDLPESKIVGTPFEQHYVNHGLDLYPHDASGVQFSAKYFNAKGDPIANLHENMAAEQKARATYEHLINISDDPGVIDALRFLRQREVVHFQRFGEALRIVQEYQDSKKIF
ncbi:manganese catalase family protein [Defluviitalea raffinosedens]|jgi:spore coat protein JC|uniref:Manganese catalase family protein n=1 Tax=Defluviitalea raffinosedens TaxID=1450156 RepID=A0A7C8LE77_9FIRM|nr:manganese catalase family protein [Defluviitalea raffinosedens]KAE9636981.1 manganese catalase family protein [Defluviitalea raffinosedens]MBM7685267.1 spore coat protein JC [Defluviitalea raffinosedens]MBZ4668833.1 manganese containing catalase [Defluviitaleaceae bacterium]HHW67294.1 manganese catalase family protein [Candidatus Epulonipiscium sp.]